MSIRFAASVLAPLVLTLSSPLAAHAAGPLDPYLPKSGTIEGHVMMLGVAPEDQAIDRRFRLAVQNNMDWFKKYVTGNKSGQPLPYDRRMGVTPAEYDQLQHMHADFRQGAAISITVTKKPDGSIGFSSTSPDAATLSKVTFPADEKVAETPFGSLSIFNMIDQKDEKAPIGVWQGAEWAQVKESGADEPSAKLAFGKRSPSGDGVMYLQVASFKDKKEQSLVVFYKLD